MPNTSTETRISESNVRHAEYDTKARGKKESAGSLPACTRSRRDHLSFRPLRFDRLSRRTAMVTWGNAPAHDVAPAMPLRAIHFCAARLTAARGIAPIKRKGGRSRPVQAVHSTARPASGITGPRPPLLLRVPEAPEFSPQPPCAQRMGILPFDGQAPLSSLPPSSWRFSAQSLRRAQAPPLQRRQMASRQPTFSLTCPLQMQPT
jgi:hypothetical protein